MRDRFFSRFLHGRDPIRALYVVPSDGFGGVERQLSCVLPQMPAWGVEVLPLVGPASTLVSWLEEEGMGEVVHSQAFELPGDSSGAVGRLVSLGLAWRGARRIGDEVDRLIHERMIDVVVATGPLGWMAATEPARRLGVPLVWSAPDAPGPGDRAIGRALSRFGRPDLLLCASELSREGWSTIVHAPTEVVTGAVDLNRFRRGCGQPDQFRPAAAPEVVGHVGRLDRTASAAMNDFIDMAARLRVHRPEARFLVTGDGPERARAEARAQDRGLGGALDFLGYLSDMRSFYAACDVLVARPSPGRIGQAALEAMAMHVPVVEGADEAAVGALLADASLATALTARNHERARRDFDAQRTARRTARLLHTLVAWSGAAAAPPVLDEHPRARLVHAT
jgi:hypothetical protein